jgi:hypothetical protein
MRMPVWRDADGVVEAAAVAAKRMWVVMLPLAAVPDDRLDPKRIPVVRAADLVAWAAIDPAMVMLVEREAPRLVPVTAVPPMRIAV